MNPDIEIKQYSSNNVTIVYIINLLQLSGYSIVGCT